MNNIVLYTCITNDYDKLIEINNPEKNIDYICFSDSLLISKTWKIIQISNHLNLDNARLSRYPKIMPHLFLKDYDKSIYVDARVQVIGNITQFVLETLQNYNWYVCKHPSRTCIYQEYLAIKKQKKDSDLIIDNQIKKYKKEGFPENFGLTANGLLLRRHNEKDCIEISTQWWNEIIEYSKRDQLSFKYVSWKNPDFKFGIMDKKILYNSRYFKIIKR